MVIKVSIEGETRYYLLPAHAEECLMTRQISPKKSLRPLKMGKDR
jgi:hypothetical protein